jgi:hypothetical protein
MCFSAEASFTASGLILLTGIISISEAKTAGYKYLAVIPLLFAAQQAIEGFLWLTMDAGAHAVWKQVLTHSFLLFAWVVWPVYIPIAMRKIETRPKRKRVFTLFLLIGIVVSAGLVYVMVFHDVKAVFSNYHIDYKFDYNPGYSWITNSMYLIPTIGSLMISSVKKVWLMGVFNFLAYAFTKIFFFGYVISIWCFFGAVISTLVLWIIMSERRKAAFVDKFTR